MKRTFDIIDRTKSGRIRLDEIKSISSLIENGSDADEKEGTEDDQGLEGEELKLRQELDDLYEQVKERLEKKNTTLENIVYDLLKYMPQQFCNTKGIQ